MTRDCGAGSCVGRSAPEFVCDSAGTRVTENNDSTKNQNYFRGPAEGTSSSHDVREYEYSTTNRGTFVGVSIHPKGTSCGRVRSALESLFAIQRGGRGEKEETRGGEEGWG